MKKILLLLTVIINISYASLIKGNVKIYHVDSHIPFAVIFDSTYVLLGTDHKNKLFMTLEGYLPKKYYKQGDIKIDLIPDIINTYGNTPKIPVLVPTDTIYIFSDTLLIDTIGYTWPLENNDQLFHIDTLLQSKNCYNFMLYGHIDSSGIIEIHPWDYTIKRLSESKNLFSLTYREINTAMINIGRYCTRITGTGLEYSHIYDEHLISPDVAILCIFIDGVLKSIWTKANINGFSKNIYEGKFIYFDKSLEIRMPEIEEEINQIIQYVP